MTILVHINRPDVFLIPSDLDQTICEGELVTFEATSGGVIVDFEFFLNGVSLNTPSPNDSIYSTNSLVDQDSISVTVFENGCPTENPASMIFTVLDAPNLTWVSSDADSTICYSDSVAFTASSSDTSIQYRYLVNGFVETMYSASGFYWNNTLNDMDTVFVVAQNPNNCRDTLEMPFTVHPLPTTAMVDDVAGSVICANDLITFSTSGAATYEFYVNGVSQFGPSPSSSWSTTSLITGDVVTVMGYSTENCQYMAPESFSYTVNPLPSVGMTISDPDTSICSGTLVNFTSSGASLYELFKLDFFRYNILLDRQRWKLERFLSLVIFIRRTNSRMYAGRERQCHFRWFILWSFERYCFRRSTILFRLYGLVISDQ